MKKKLPLWSVLLVQFKIHGWRLDHRNIGNHRIWRSHSQLFSQLRKRRVKIILDKIVVNNEELSRWTIPDECRSLALRYIESPLARIPIPAANLEPPPTVGMLFDAEGMLAEANREAQFILRRDA